MPGTFVPVRDSIEERLRTMVLTRRTVGNDGALDDGSKELCTFWETETFEATADSVDETERGGPHCQPRGVDLE